MKNYQYEEIRSKMEQMEEDAAADYLMDIACAYLEEQEGGEGELQILSADMLCTPKRIHINISARRGSEGEVFDCSLLIASNETTQQQDPGCAHAA